MHINSTVIFIKRIVIHNRKNPDIALIIGVFTAGFARRFLLPLTTLCFSKSEVTDWDNTSRCVEGDEKQKQAAVCVLHVCVCVSVYEPTCIQTAFNNIW